MPTAASLAAELDAIKQDAANQRAAAAADAARADACRRNYRTDAFLPRDALLSAVYAVVVCLCVCVCVCHTPVLYQNG